MSLKWIAENLSMGTWTNVSNLLRPSRPQQNLYGPVRLQKAICAVAAYHSASTVGGMG